VTKNTIISYLYFLLYLIITEIFVFVINYQIQVYSNIICIEIQDLL